MLARLARAEELTAVWVPDPVHEAMRDVVRASESRPRASSSTSYSNRTMASAEAGSSEPSPRLCGKRNVPFSNLLYQRA